ncbi:MAG: Pilus assembly protein CpaB [Paucimonas sp.]|nr:Pilus assembly protein CpaB [Paucimonas sp.]
MKLALLKNLKLNKTWIVLGVAVGIGLLAALAARSYLASQMAAIEARARGEQVQVVVAKRPIAKGEKISADKLALRFIPVAYAHSAAVKPNEVDNIEGLPLAYPVNPGEMIVWGLVEGKKTATFSARIENGRRAITVAVDEINSISGMLEPGDLVDMMLTLDHDGKRRTFPLLQNMQVLATGQRAVDDPKNGERRQYSTVTLDATPQQAQDLIVAREAGKITALLRNPQDKQPLGAANVDLAALLGLTGDGASRTVPVLYGGRGGKLSSEGLNMAAPARPAVVERLDSPLDAAPAPRPPAATASAASPSKPERPEKPAQEKRQP